MRMRHKRILSSSTILLYQDGSQVIGYH